MVTKWPAICDYFRIPKHSLLDSSCVDICLCFRLHCLTHFKKTQERFQLMYHQLCICGVSLASGSFCLYCRCSALPVTVTHLSFCTHSKFYLLCLQHVSCFWAGVHIMFAHLGWDFAIYCWAYYTCIGLWQMFPPKVKYTFDFYTYGYNLFLFSFRVAFSSFIYCICRLTKII